MALEIGGGDCLTKTHNSAKKYLEVLSLTSARHLYINTIVRSFGNKVAVNGRCNYDGAKVAKFLVQ